MKRTLFKYVIVLFCLSSFQCAYFNTFYNAKRYYNKAHHETKKNRTGKPTSAELSNYQKAIEKALKLVDFYPNSKYVDDALLLMAKAYYHRQEYLRARQKFLELNEAYPESKLVPESNFWLAKTELALEEFDQAEQRLNRLLTQEIPDELKGEANYSIGKLREKKREFEEAIRAYQRALENGGVQSKPAVLFAIGTNYDSLQVYDKAAEYFREVLEHHPMPDLRFEAQFRHARVKRKQGHFDEAIRLFEALLGDEQNKQRAPDLRLEIGDCLRERGDIDDAIVAYQDIIQEHKKTMQSAEANYILGKLLEEYRRDYERAAEYFDQVKKEYPRSVYADSAMKRHRNIQRFLALKQVIRMARRGEEGQLEIFGEEVEEDSLSVWQLHAMMDSTAGDSARQALLLQIADKAFVDSVLVRTSDAFGERYSRGLTEDPSEKQTPVVDWAEWVEDGQMPSYADLEEELKSIKKYLEQSKQKTMAENPELKAFQVEELDKNLFLLAELYLFQFSLPDSAANQYRRLLSQFPDSPYAPHALYNLGYIAEDVTNDSALSESYYRRLIRDYPRSSFSNAARQVLGIAPISAEEDSVHQLLIEAESLLFERQDPVSASRKYREVLERFPDSDWAPKAAYAMGWIYENRLDSDELALSIYEALLERYPETVFAKRVRKKVETVKKQSEEEIGESIESVGEDLTSTVTDDSTKQTIAPKGEERLPKELRKVAPEEEESWVEGGYERDAAPVGGTEAILQNLAIPEGVVLKSSNRSATVRVLVSELGKILQAEFVRSTGESTLDRAVLEAIQATRFLAAIKDGKTVSSWTTLNILIDEGEEPVEIEQ